MQCFACQRFGHSSLNCGYTQQCVKCAGSLLAKDCVKSREAEPKWTNCNDAHLDNYIKYPFLLQVKANCCPSWTRFSSIAALSNITLHLEGITKLSYAYVISIIQTQTSKLKTRFKIRYHINQWINSKNQLRQDENEGRIHHNSYTSPSSHQLLWIKPKLYSEIVRSYLRDCFNLFTYEWKLTFFCLIKYIL